MHLLIELVVKPPNSQEHTELISLLH
ncbi:hypothetical protein Zm00014a_008160 [Zea mays]|uniref:Uncharacterized protein n=1 Tax=Zea mays TaxID=4577 RepID=A0A3L6FHP6_MAIZE|nr:hypothetical protein Zm00014a_008160 [Zea mays]